MNRPPALPGVTLTLAAFRKPSLPGLTRGHHARNEENETKQQNLRPPGGFASGLGRKEKEGLRGFVWVEDGISG